MDTIYDANDEKYHMRIIKSVKRMNEIYKTKENWRINDINSCVV
jgi:hypothetical protein